jgi:hypothetical protein
MKRGQRRVSSTETTIPETTPITTSGERPLERLGEAEPDRVVAASPAKGGGDQDWEADAERGAHLGASGEEVKSPLGLLQTHVATAKTRRNHAAVRATSIQPDVSQLAGVTAGRPLRLGRLESHPFERAGRAAEPAGEGQEAPSASSRELTGQEPPLGGVQARRGTSS